MTDSEKTASLEKRIYELERIIKVLSANDDKEALKLSLTTAPAVLRFDFTDSNTLENLSYHLGNAIIKSKDGMLSFDISDNEKAEFFADPILSISDIDIDASDVKYLHVVFKANLEKSKLRGWYDNNIYYNAYAQFYFKTDTDREWSQSKSLSIFYCSGELTDCYVEIKNPLWKGRIVGIRFDPSEKLLGNAEIHLIELLPDVSSTGIGGWMKNTGNRLDMLTEKIENIENELKVLKRLYIKGNDTL